MNESSSRNEAVGINGILCGGRGWFVQALEGPESQLMPLYASILRDARHRDLTLLSIGLVSSRAFPQWAMNFVDGEPLGSAFHDSVLAKVLSDSDPSAAVQLLQATLKLLRKGN